MKIILEGQDSTNYTFFRVARHKIEGDFQIHNNPEWQHDTISVSSQNQGILLSLGKALATGVKHFIIFDGNIGQGKDQVFNLISLADECPVGIKDKIKIA